MCSAAKCTDWLFVLLSRLNWLLASMSCRLELSSFDYSNQPKPRHLILYFNSNYYLIFIYFLIFLIFSIILNFCLFLYILILTLFNHTFLYFDVVSFERLDSKSETKRHDVTSNRHVRRVGRVYSCFGEVRGGIDQIDRGRG